LAKHHYKEGWGRGSSGEGVSFLQKLACERISNTIGGTYCCWPGCGNIVPKFFVEVCKFNEIEKFLDGSQFACEFQNGSGFVVVGSIGGRR
jgi:hypothetical protein